MPGSVLIWIVSLSRYNDTMGGHYLLLSDEEKQGYWLIIFIGFMFYGETICFLPLQPRVPLRLPILSPESSFLPCLFPFLLPVSELDDFVEAQRQVECHAAGGAPPA